MAVYVDDRYLNSQDSDFVNLVISDLQTFLDAAEEKADQWVVNCQMYCICINIDVQMPVHSVTLSVSILYAVICCHCVYGFITMTTWKVCFGLAERSNITDL